MTITEQLQFSVLTAPVATLDRRTLSQAWYSALYGNAAKSSAKPKRGGVAVAAATASQHSAPGGLGQDRAAQRGVTARAQSAESTNRAALPANERRAPRSPLARKIERALLRPRTASHKTSFSVDGDEGRVHVLLHARGTQFRLIAICPPKARANVAAALAQARYALAARGIELSAETRGAQTC